MQELPLFLNKSLFILFSEYEPPRIDERKIPMPNEYIAEINKLLPYADVELLDYVLQLLQKSVTPSEEQLQTA